MSVGFQICVFEYGSLCDVDIRFSPEYVFYIHSNVLSWIVNMLTHFLLFISFI